MQELLCCPSHGQRDGQLLCYISIWGIVTKLDTYPTLSNIHWLNYLRSCQIHTSLMSRSLLGSIPCVWTSQAGLDMSQLGQVTWRIYAALKSRPTVPVRPDWIETRSTEPLSPCLCHGMKMGKNGRNIVISFMGLMCFSFFSKSMGISCGKW